MILKNDGGGRFFDRSKKKKKNLPPPPPPTPLFSFRRRTGILQGDLLAVIDSWDDPVRRAEAHAILEEEEAKGAAALALATGVHPLLRRLDAAGIPRGLVTRNNGAAVAAFHDALHPLPPFAPALDRGYGGRPKPHPDPLVACATAWGVCPTQVAMVGDSLDDDVAAGVAAGAATILLDPEGRHGDGSHYEPHLRPTAVASSLEHAAELLEELFDLVPPEAAA